MSLTTRRRHIMLKEHRCKPSMCDQTRSIHSINTTIELFFNIPAVINVKCCLNYHPMHWNTTFVFITITDCGAVKSQGLRFLSKYVWKTCLSRINFRQITLLKVCVLHVFTISEITDKYVFRMRFSVKRVYIYLASAETLLTRGVIILTLKNVNATTHPACWLWWNGCESESIAVCAQVIRYV